MDMGWELGLLRLEEKPQSPFQDIRELGKGYGQRHREIGQGGTALS